jgi:Ca2+-binding RTX toxin-like protein
LANNLVTLTASATITDYDGDSATDSETIDLGGNIKFADDGPTAINPNAAVLNNQGTLTTPVMFTGKLDFDGNVDDNVGADQLGTVRFLPSLHNTNSGLTSGGVPIIYSVSDDGHTLTGNAGSLTIFTVDLYLDANAALSNDTYTVTMYGKVDTLINIDFNDMIGYQFYGGNASWAGFGTADNDNSADLLLTPINSGVSSGTVNTNANEGGIDNNSLGSGEAMRLDFVTDLAGTPVNGKDYSVLANQTHEFEGHYTTNGASARFTNTSNSKVRIKAFDDDDTVLNTVGDGTQLSINAVAIIYNGETRLITFAEIGTAATNFTVGSHIFNVQFVDGEADGIQYEALVNGVVSDTQIATYTPDGYNSLEIGYEAGNTFKIGDFGAAVISSEAPVDFTVPVQIVDYDGDSAPGTIDVLLLPENAPGTQNYSESAFFVTATSTNLEPHIIGSNYADTLSGDSGNNILFGGDDNDIINGNNGNDWLLGGEGNDILNGGSGIDTLSGGKGNDTLTGGADADRFVFEPEMGNDHITDMSLKAGGDFVDLSNVMKAGYSLSVSNDGTGHVKLTIFDGATEKGSITFDNMSYDTAHDTVAELKNLINIDDTP